MGDVSFGLQVKRDNTGGVRIYAECKHQHGLLYILAGGMNWVCAEEWRPAHALAGFFKELDDWGDPRVRELMRRWGMYFRELPLAQAPDESEAK